ncbi:MAG: histidine phosphatase family protein [Flavobacteriales bacterium]|nr:histidine phosphatase family protein [Flavobacteriales bacterium]
MQATEKSNIQFLKKPIFYVPFITICIVFIYWWFLPLPTTTFVLVRHAEKTGNGQQDPISALGFQRADSLAYTLKYMDLDAIYATQYLRTRQTVSKVAQAEGINITPYNATSDSLQVRAFLLNILNTKKGKRILIAGHSNTIPLMLNILEGKNNFPNINGSVFDNLFISPAKYLSGNEIYHLKYGLHNE